MASGKDYLEYILDQLSGLDDISYRAMMGEYIIYYRGKVVGGIYDNRFLVKPVKAAVTMMPDAELELPYEGAKEILKAKKEKRDPILLPDFSCHHLRHTFCTRLCENETNLKVIQSIMGHRNIETTMDVYAEATDRKKKETIDNLSKLDIF